MRCLQVSVALVGAGHLAAASTPQEGASELRFIACPVYRDTDSGAKSGCWLATDPVTGIRYDISLSNTKPDWNRPALVEGRLADRPGSECGAPVLEPLVVSVMPGSCTRHELPAEGFGGHHYVLSPRHILQIDKPGPIPVGPYSSQVFRALFGYDRSFLAYQYDDWLLDKAVSYIKAAHPSRVTVTGYADTRPQDVSGTVLAERASIARERAERVAEALRRLGVARTLIKTRWQSDAKVVDAELADGLRAPTRRRVDIDVHIP